MSRNDIKKSKRIRAVILAPRFHVLIHNDCGGGKPSMLTRLNEAARKKWTDVSVEFEAWKFKLGDSSPRDFEFSKVCG